MTRSHPLIAMARVVGDFSNPFYDEERQRDVWNEASAFGLQLLLWGSLIVATALVWTVGAPALPYATGLLALIGVASLLTLGYAHLLGISITGTRMVRARMVPLALLVVAFSGGLWRAAEADSFSSSFAKGMVTGALAGMLALFVAARRPRT